MENYIISNTYTLPSLGKVYKTEVKPTFTVRSMTTEEEMRRLNPTERTYKNIADIIDACMIESPGISAYDMCLGDYQFCLHKVRVVTYGSNYKLSTTCPYCGGINSGEINLEEMQVLSYSDDLKKYFEFDLPRTGRHITLKMQTPRILDNISIQAKELKKKTSGSDPAFLFTATSLIDTVDREKPDPLLLEDFVRKLPMMDTNFIMENAKKINEGIGLNTTLDNTCDVCGLDYASTFRTTPEFFRPTID